MIQNFIPKSSLKREICTFEYHPIRFQCTCERVRDNDFDIPINKESQYISEIYISKPFIQMERSHRVVIQFRHQKLQCTRIHAHANLIMIIFLHTIL